MTALMSFDDKVYHWNMQLKSVNFTESNEPLVINNDQ